MSDSAIETSSVLRVCPSVNPRKIKKVPFVEMFAGRLQGVVSAGSDIRRVYVSFYDAKTHNFSCSTNNNRVCGGLRHDGCKHLDLLLNEAVIQYGAAKVISFLNLNEDPESLTTGTDIVEKMNGQHIREESSMVFSRFLNHLRYMELAPSVKPIPEMQWFL